MKDLLLIYNARLIDSEHDIKNGAILIRGGKIEGLLTKPAAKKLMQDLLKAGREAGAEEFTLEVRVSNVPAIKVYESAGFVSEGIRPGFYEDPKEDANIMWIRKK